MHCEVQYLSWGIDDRHKLLEMALQQRMVQNPILQFQTLVTQHIISQEKPLTLMKTNLEESVLLNRFGQRLELLICPLALLLQRVHPVRKPTVQTWYRFPSRNISSHRG